MKRPRALVAVMVVLAIASLAVRARAAHAQPVAGAMPTSRAAAVDVQWHVRVPMRDGVVLHATVYRPASLAGATRERLPLILTMTPYTSDSYHAQGMFFARHGYLFAVVDVRGRGNSGGRYAPFQHDGTDGADAVEWLARIDGCDGQVAMWGGSYAGFVQWATAKERPPALKTIVPAAAVYPGHDFPSLKGITYLSSLFWLAGTAGATANGHWEEDADYWLTRSARAHRLSAPFRVLDTLSGFPSSIWQEWLDHPVFDAYWQRAVPDRAQYAQIDIPVLTITGYYDVDQPGALRYYREHLTHATAKARAQHYLLLGPWDHAGMRAPRAHFAGLTMGPGSLLDLLTLHIAWYDHVMKGGPVPPMLSAPVRYYQPARDRWASAPTLAAITQRIDTLHLRVDRSTARWSAPGALSGRRASAPWSATIDADLSAPGAMDADHRWDPFHYASTGRMQSLGIGALVFDWQAPAGGREIAGQFGLYIPIWCTDEATDLSADLYVVEASGRVRWLTGDLARTPCRAVDGGSVSVFMRDFPVTAVRIAAPQRLRLVISTPSLALFEPHYGGAGATTSQTRGRSRPRRISLEATTGADAVLLLPVAR